MKRTSAMLSMLFAVILFTTGTAAYSQEAQTVHYTDGNTKRPDFTNALIAIDFPPADEAAAATARKLFANLGARDFSVGNNPCSRQQDVICVRMEVGAGMMVSGSGMSSSYGSRGGFSTSGSFSGTNYPVIIKVFLVKLNGGDRKTIMLGEASDLAPEGSGSESTSGYSRGGGGTLSMNNTSSLDSVRDNSARKALTSLLNKHLLARFISCGQYANWYGGAATLVQQTFRP